MSSILVINAAGRETRVALVEGGHIAEFYLERKKDKGVVGNIYKGRVVRVLPGMQAAFVDIGLDKAAFLYVTDVVYDVDFARAQFELTEGEHDDAPEVPEMDEESLGHGVAGAAELEIAGEGAEPGPTPAAEELSGSPATAGPPNASELGESAQVPPSELAQSVPVPPSDLAESAQVPLLAPGPSVAERAPPPEPASLVPAASSAVAGDPPEAPAPDAGERRLPRENRENREVRPRDRHRWGREDRQGRKRERDEEERPPRKSSRIEDLLKVGQEVVVQISKDPIGTKGARLTSHISIPGRHLVFMPTVDHVGISRRISNEKERRRLRELVDRLRPPGTGFIVRTVAENVPAEKLESDIRFLIEVWNQVVRKNDKRTGPGLLHPDLDLILRATRDLFAHDVEKLVIDDKDEYERVLSFVAAQDVSLRDRVLLHDNEEPIFDAYGIEQEINRALQRKVWLKSGGYLIIDQAEALTAIDVNSGRYVGKKSLEETITKINVEAAKEIVYQLRLRNIGGIIICDFIDMEKPQNRDKVFKSLQEALGRDKAKTNVLRISELGLVEMTRKRVRESIGRMLHEDCGYCEGRGFVKTATTLAYEIFRELRREAPTYRDPTLVINCNPDVAKLIQGEERDELRHLMDRYNKSISIRPQPNYHREQYDIYGRSSQGIDHRLSGSTGAPALGGSPPPRAEASEAPRGRDRSRDRRGERGGGPRGDRHRERGRDWAGGSGEHRERPAPDAHPGSLPNSAEAAGEPAPPPGRTDEPSEDANLAGPAALPAAEKGTP